MTTYKYLGYTIQPKMDFGSQFFFIDGKRVSRGWVVTDGFCNVLPGATWSQTIAGAKKLIVAHVESKGNAALFWKIVKARSLK